MPIISGRYVAPTWNNGRAPAINASELQAISDSIAKLDGSDVLALLGTYNEHWWSVLHGEAGFIYVEGKSDITGSDNIRLSGSAHTTFSWATSVTVDESTGDITLNNPTSHSVSYYWFYSQVTEIKSELQSHLPCYVKTNSSDVYYLPVNTTFGNAWNDTIGFPGDDDSYSCDLHPQAYVKAQRVFAKAQPYPAGDITYVHSSDRNAYPDDGTVGNLTYHYLGIPLANLPISAKFETGHYVGSGTYGLSNPTTISFSFNPRLVVIYKQAGYSPLGGYPSNSYGQSLVYLFGKSGTINAVSYTLPSGNETFAYLDYQISANTLSMVSYRKPGGTKADPEQPSTGYSPQYNTSGVTYHYIAIG